MGEKFKYQRHNREDSIQIVIEPEYVLLCRSCGDSGSIICTINDKVEEPQSVRIMRKTNEWDMSEFFSYLS